jgi:hypothetical protein
MTRTDWFVLARHVIALALVAVGAYMLGTRRADPSEVPVSDLALVLAADVSGSMSIPEIELQRKAYAAALSHPDVWQAVKEGAHGNIWVAYLEWSDCEYQRILIKWTRIETQADLLSVASAIGSRTDSGSRGNTCLSGAMKAAHALLTVKPEAVERMVVDISGDGTHNIGEYPTEARNRLVEIGATINGLPITVDENPTILINWYRDHVIGGPGAFVEPVKGFENMEPALRRKLVMEIG